MARSAGSVLAAGARGPGRLERGFFGFLLSNPMLLLAAALGIALIVTGVTAKIYKSQRDTARSETEQIRAQFAGFRAEVERLGEEAKAKAAAEEKRQKEVNDGLQKRLKALGGVNAELRRTVERLRERPITDASGDHLPTRTDCPAGADGKGAAEYISVEHYRALESRAAYDAQTVMLWREWATSQGLAR